MPAGRLIVCATPIGNLGDITLRVLDALRAADTIAAEDTRVTRRLLARYDIHVPLERYDEHTAHAKTPEIVDRIEAGATVALVSDAGTPGISDPGTQLIDACRSAALTVDVLPGPSAIVTALVASGLPADAFYFGGFLPRKAAARVRAIQALADLDATLVFYESPRRTASALASLAEVLPGRECAIARELTKVHEEVLRGPIERLAAEIAERELKGEVVVVVGPPPQARPARVDPDTVRARVDEFVSSGLTRRDAVTRASEELGVARSVVYEIAHSGHAD